MGVLLVREGLKIGQSGTSPAGVSWEPAGRCRCIEGMSTSRSPGRAWSLRLAVLAAVPLLLVAPSLVLAKWTVEVNFEPTRAVAGEPAELAAVIEVESHDVPGESMPTLADVEAVQFRVRPVGGGESIVVPAAA